MDLFAGTPNSRTRYFSMIPVYNNRYTFGNGMASSLLVNRQPLPGITAMASIITYNIILSCASVSAHQNNGRSENQSLRTEKKRKEILRER